MGELCRRTLNPEPRTLNARRAKRAGLTLIEVMLAITILGMGLSVLIVTASRCLAVIRQAKNFETARHLLGQVEAEHPINPDEIEEGSDDGSFLGENEGFRWQREIAKVEVATGGAADAKDSGLYMITTTVSWADREHGKSEKLVTYLYAPDKKKTGTVTGPGTNP